jgi:hypothetical protein
MTLTGQENYLESAQIGGIMRHNSARMIGAVSVLQKLLLSGLSGNSLTAITACIIGRAFALIPMVLPKNAT